jgi:hypothetical protein
VNAVNRRMSIVFQIALILSFLLSSCSAVAMPATVPMDGGVASIPPVPCDGSLWELAKGTTAYGVQRALSGVPGTARYIKDGALVLLWPIKNQGVGMLFLRIKDLTYATSTTDLVSKVGLGGLSNFKTTNDFVNWLTNTGWTSVSVTGLAQAVGEATLAQAATVASKAPIFVVMFSGTPMTLDEIEDYMFPDFESEGIKS